MTPTLAVYSTTIASSFAKAAIDLCVRHHLLPEAYLYGWTDILRVPGARATFLFGKLYTNVRWYFFPLVFLTKTTIALPALLACVPLARLWRRRREFLFLVTPAAVYLTIAILSGLDIQARYLLPIYPFFIVLAGAAAWDMARRSRPFAIGVGALLLFTVASSLHAFPDYLAYSNEAFGGPSHTWRHLSASNNDWGQGLKWAKGYLDANQVSDCWFDNSNPFVDPAYYGIPCKPLVSALVLLGFGRPVPVMPETISGTVLVSSTELDGHRWGPDVLNPYAQFSHLRPDAILGNVILVYHGTFHVPLASAYTHLATAETLLREKKIDEAVAQAEEAARLAPDSANIQAGLGRTLMAAGRTQDAQHANAIALQLARTTHPEFQKALIDQLEAPGTKSTLRE